MNDSVQTSQDPPDLKALAKEINSLASAIRAEEGKIEKAQKSCLQAARRIGEALLTVRDSLKGNGYKKWVEANCRFSYVTSTKYVNVAEKAAREGFDLETFNGGIDAFLGYTSKMKDTPRSPAPAAPKEAAPADTVSTPVPTLDLEADRRTAPIDDLDPEVSRELERALNEEEAKPVARAPATESPPRAPMRDTHDADLKALKAWQKEAGDPADIRLIAAVRAVVLRARLSGGILASEEALAEKVGKALKRDLSPAIVTAAYRQMLELEAPGGPLCIFRKTAPRGATAADMANVRDTARKIAERREREAIEAKAKREAAHKEAEELLADLPTELVISELPLGEAVAA
ncbi:MAG: hypothetical protein J0I31_11575 [Rhizobiales bacterium]|nr:hypothetical protein [Hyphomicrobiales bacterium]